jgi:hypothetical protein
MRITVPLVATLVMLLVSCCPPLGSARRQQIVQRASRERPSMALLLEYPPPIPTPSTHHLSVARTLLAKTYFKCTCPCPQMGRHIWGVFNREKHIGWAEREILTLFEI